MILLAQGDFGSGKSSLLSLFGKLALSSGIPVLANYNLQGSRKMQGFQDLADHRGLILLDEAQTVLDSRRFSKDGSIFVSQLFMYMRKLNSLLMMSSPRDSFVDIRMRDLANVYVYCEPDGDGFSWSFYRGSQLLGNYFVAAAPLYSFLDDAFDTYEYVRPVAVPKTENDFQSIIDLMVQSNSFLQ